MEVSRGRGLAFFGAILALLSASESTVDAATCGDCDQTLTLNITFDRYPREVTWTLSESSTSTTTDCSVDVSASGGPYNDDTLYEAISTQICAFQTYNFTILDSSGDGICCGNPNDQRDHGHYSLLLGDIEVASGGEYDYKETTIFQTENAPSQTPTPVPTPVPTVTAVPTISQAPTVCPCTQTASLDITFDEYPTQVKWVLNTSEASPSAQCTESLSVTGGPYPLGTESVSVDMSTELCAGQTYRFVMLDDGDDGLCCEWGDGSYTVKLNGDTVGSGSEFGSTSSFTFTAPQSPTMAPTVGTENPTHSPTLTPQPSKPPTPLPTPSPTLTPKPTSQPTLNPTTAAPTDFPPDSSKSGFNSTSRTISIVVAVSIAAATVCMVILYNTYFSRDAQRQRKQKQGNWDDGQDPDDDNARIFEVSDVHADSENQAQNTNIEMTTPLRDQN